MRKFMMEGAVRLDSRIWLLMPTGLPEEFTGAGRGFRTPPVSTAVTQVAQLMGLHRKHYRRKSHVPRARTQKALLCPSRAGVIGRSNRQPAQPIIALK